MKNHLFLKVLVALIGFFGLVINTFAATQHVYVYKGSDIVYRTTADKLDSVVLEQNKTIISLYSKDGTRLYSAAYSEIDSIKYVTLPEADLLDVQFNADGTATDISPMISVLSFVYVIFRNVLAHFPFLVNSVRTQLTDFKRPCSSFLVATICLKRTFIFFL